MWLYSQLTYIFVAIYFSASSNNSIFYFYLSWEFTIFGLKRLISLGKQGYHKKIINIHQDHFLNPFFRFLFFLIFAVFKKMVVGFQPWTCWSFSWTGLARGGISILNMSLLWKKSIVLYLKCGVCCDYIMHHCVRFSKENGCVVPTLNMLIIFCEFI